MFAAIVLLLTWPAFAETSADTLRRGPGARPAGMGGAFVAVADDAHAALWNPAGLSLIRRPSSFLSHYGFSGTRIETAGYAQPWGTGGLGAHLALAHGSRSAAKLGAAASTRVLHALHLGGGASWARASEHGESSATMLFDLGLLATTLPGVTVGAAAQNLGTGRILGLPPENWRLGTAVRFDNTDLQQFYGLSGLLVALEINYARARRQGSVNLGAEYRRRRWAYRLGLSGGPKDQAEGRRVAFGLGWKRHGIGLDYTIAPTSGHGDDHRLGVTYEFGYLIERPAADYLLRRESDEVVEQSEAPASVHLIERRFARAEGRFLAGQPKLGLRELEHVRRLLDDDDPRLLRYYDAVGRGLLVLVDWKAARENYVEGITLARRLNLKGVYLGHLYAGLGGALAGEGRFAEALRFLEAALKEGTAPERRRPAEDLILKLKYLK